MMHYNTLDEKNLVMDAYEQINRLYDLLIDSILMKDFHIKAPFYCFTNFKDAVFHFFRLCISDDNGDKLDQYFALQEHISRAQKDYFAHGLNFMNFCLEKLIQNVMDNSIKNYLRKVLHASKELLFAVRFSGMLMTTVRTKVDRKMFEASVTEFKEVIVKYDLGNDFRKFRNEYSKHKVC